MIDVVELWPIFNSTAYIDTHIAVLRLSNDKFLHASQYVLGRGLGVPVSYASD